MKTKFGTKLLSLLLCVCMLIPMFTACGNKDKDDDTPLSWEATEDQVIPLEMDIQNDESNTTLVLTYGEDIFSSIENDQIKLTVYQKAVSSDETNESKESFIDESTPTDFTASVTNAKQLTITVPSTENDWGYLVVVHSSAISSGKFGEAFGFNSEIIEESVSYSASISGEYATGDVNPVITVTLENTVAAAGLTKEMITLTGLFEGLEITSVSGSESTITIVTSGTIAVATSFFAGVELAEGATNSGVALSADCKVAYRSAYVKQDSFALASGTLTFDVVIASDTVTLAVNDALTADGITYTVKAVSEDKTTITLGVETTASDLDSAIAEINGKVLEIPANKTASANLHTLTVYAFSASVGGSVDYIEEASTANTYSATAILFVKNGAWNGTLTASDITLGGDFDGATVTSVTKDGDSYEIVFTFVKEGLDLEDVSLDGAVMIVANKVKNAWGTNLAENDAELTYVTGLDRGKTWDEIKAFLANYKDTFDSISTVGSVVGGVASAANGIKTILELAGVIETTNDKLDKINDQLEIMNSELLSLNEKVSKLSHAVTTGNAAIIDRTEYNSYLIANTGWNSFNSSKVDPLIATSESYTIAYNTYILNWISNASKENGNIDVFLVEKIVKETVAGTTHEKKVLEATMPHPLFSSSNQYSVEGEKLHSVGTYRLEAPLDKVISGIMKNGGKLYTGYWDDISKSDIAVIGVTGEEADISLENFLNAVQLSASLYALNEVGAAKILSEFKNFCNALVGGGIAVKPLDYYYIMISTYYNFYGEAKADIELTQAWLASLLKKYSGLATLAYTYTIGADATPISYYVDIALNELTTNTGEQSSDKYSYVSGAKLEAAQVYGLTEEFALGGYPRLVEVGFLKDKEAREKLIRDLIDAVFFQPRTNKTEELYNQLVKESEPPNMPSNVMSTADCLVMVERYKRLYAAGVTTAKTFGAYLVSIGIIDQNIESLSKMCIITGPVDYNSKAIPKNNTMKATVSRIICSTWVKNGNSITVGKNGNFTANCFSGNYLSSDVIDYNGKATSDYVFSAYIEYSEFHWYWSTDEWWYASIEHDGPMFLFVLN